MSPLMKRLLWRPYNWFLNLLFDPLELVKKYRALPQFVCNWRDYQRINRDPRFEIRLREVWYRAHDRYATAGTAHGHYFFQDLWAARRLYDWGIKTHVDVGSRLDGFIAHILPFCHLTYVDIRPLGLDWAGFTFKQGSITQMPFEDGSVPTLSSLHVIEHIGLGRYGDTVDPDGYLKAAAELSRVLAHGGWLLLGTPVGRERLCFDAHRVFDPETIVQAFRGLALAEFFLVDDTGLGIIADASFEQARRCEYGCGLFVFEKPMAKES
jgi:SAM-dependent methyltransferase